MARLATVADLMPRTCPQPFEAIGTVTETDGDKQLEVTMTTISPDGCSFRSPVPFCPGATYTLRIGAGPLYLASTLKIISAGDRSDGFFDVAATFA